MVHPNFKKWATGYSGCDGGDIGSKENPSIWFCGIEWGGGMPVGVDQEIYEKDLLEEFLEDVSRPAFGYKERDGQPSWKINLSYIYNWQAMKLLSAINGGSVSEYKKFAEDVRPFVENEKGYFKMNIYPLAFKNTSPNLWKTVFSNVTGFSTKQEYIEWIRNFRFPLMKHWMNSHNPKLIICVGIGYLNDFKNAFIDEGKQFAHEVIDEKNLFWCVNENGSIVVNIPFMVNRNGLTRNATIQKFGERIREIVNS